MKYIFALLKGIAVGIGIFGILLILIRWLAGGAG